AGEVDHEAGVKGHADPGKMGGGLLDELHALIQREEASALVGVTDDGDDDLVPQIGGDLDELEMAVVDRIEGSRVKDSCHSSTPVWMRNVTTVPPYLRLLSASMPSGAEISWSLSVTTTPPGASVSMTPRRSSAHAASSWP